MDQLRVLAYLGILNGTTAADRVARARAAGTAAGFAALGGTAVQQVDVGRVQRALAEDGPLLAA